MSIQATAGSKHFQQATRQIEDVVIMDCVGRVTVGEGNLQLRESIQDLIAKGNNKVLLNFVRIEYIDSAGIGELVRAHTTLRKQGGQLKLLNLHEKIENLLRITMLASVFDIHKDESAAVKSFDGPRTSGANPEG